MPPPIARIALFFALATSPAFAGPILAQLTLPSTPPTSQLGIKRDGSYVIAPITLDGRTLFSVAQLFATKSPNQLSLVERVTEIQASLQQVLTTTGSRADAQTVFDPRSVRVHVRHEGVLDALEVVDAKHSDPLPIVTVTPDDAAYNQTTIDSLATQWQTTLQTSLVSALESRQPAVQRSNALRVGRVAGALALASLLVFGLYRLLKRRLARLDDVTAQRRSAAEAQERRVSQDPQEAHRTRRRFFALALRNIEPERQRAIYSAVAEALLWGLALAWFVAMTWAFTLFPQTSPLAQQIVHAALAIGLTLVVTGLLNRLIDIVINRVAGVWRLRQFANAEDRARLLLRIPTIARAVVSFKTFALVFLAILFVIGALGVPVGSIVTIGGLTAIALSLAAQNLVRDFLNGLLVLLEDQYVVGDYVTINANSGLVERLTLRMVQVRDVQGDLITIPHSSVTSVVNSSRNWSRVDYRVPVDPLSDVAKAVDVVRAVIEAVASEDAWRESVIDPIEWIGIDALSKDWAIVRASVKTTPLRQFELRRLINDRVREAFAQNGIALGAQIPGVP